MHAEIAVADPPHRPAPTPSRQTIRVAMLGLGSVGQAVARLAPQAERLATSGVRFRIAAALVRDGARPRLCPQPAALTTDAEAFLRGQYDVAIEALGAVEPARTLVTRLLARQIPVVTANKALVAAHGVELSALADRHRTTLRYEASALAGVPFLGALAARPFVADVSRFAAVVNGTSNFILSTLEHDRCSFGEALERAARLGLTEPDPSRDLHGLDAADKFSLLASVFGWGCCTHTSLEVRGIAALDAADLAAARSLGATIKPVVVATRTADGIEAFVGPALVPARHSLATLDGTLSGIQLSGRFVPDLFFSGPGAGPDITAATILDDAIEAVSTVQRSSRPPRVRLATLSIKAPATEWFVRVGFPGVAPASEAVSRCFAATGLSVLQTTKQEAATEWVRVAAAPREHLDRAMATLKCVHRLDAHAIRAL
jgi:homoserine dehydrogenase